MKKENNEIKLNDAMYETLKPFEKFLYTAVKCNYVRTLTRKELNSINSVYVALTKRNRDLSCPKCVLDICQFCGRLYFNYKQDNDNG